MFSGTMVDCENDYYLNMALIEYVFKPNNIKIKNRCFRYDKYYYIYNIYSVFKVKFLEKQENLFKFIKDNGQIVIVNLYLENNFYYGICTFQNIEIISKINEISTLHKKMVYCEE
uniref:Uncharacterized protein n=1 Tax=viral metagenome TaxID=1070528 RepID=A0A6C0IA07_9ZZZZ